MTGILNIAKPTGLTSHDVVNRVRRVSGLRRVGHAGTLDPLATGVLLLCLGQATRLAEYLVGRRKSYEAVVRLGQETNSYDADGVIVAERPVNVSLEAITAALDQFRGEISQQPPMFSAVKQGGQPLYKLARQGIERERSSRRVTVYELALQSWQPPDLQLRVVCSAGTYIRSIAHDLGQRLGCGGHIRALRRTAVGDFTLATAVPLDSLTEANLVTHLQPPDTAVSHLPRLDLPAEEALALQQGRRPARQPGQIEADLARVYDPQGRFIGIATVEGGRWRPRKIFL